MIKIRYIRASFDSPVGRVRLVHGYEARALVALGIAEYYREESPADMAQSEEPNAAEVTPKANQKRGRGRKYVPVATPEIGSEGQ